MRKYQPDDVYYAAPRLRVRLRQIEARHPPGRTYSSRNAVSQEI